MTEFNVLLAPNAEGLDSLRIDRTPEDVSSAVAHLRLSVATLSRIFEHTLRHNGVLAEASRRGIFLERVVDGLISRLAELDDFMQVEAGSDASPPFEGIIADEPMPILGVVADMLHDPSLTARSIVSAIIENRQRLQQGPEEARATGRVGARYMETISNQFGAPLSAIAVPANTDNAQLAPGNTGTVLEIREATHTAVSPGAHIITFESPDWSGEES